MASPHSFSSTTGWKGIHPAPSLRSPIEFHVNLGAIMRFATLLLLFSIVPAALAQRAMTLVDFMNIPTVTGPQLSPDGREIVFTKSEPTWKANRRISHVWRVNAD